jgi:hypothetical protein
MTKPSLLQAMKTGRQAWPALLDRIDKAALTEPGVEGVWSVKEIVAHIAGYEQYFTAYLADLRPGSSNSPGRTAILDSFYQQHLNIYRQTHPDFPAQLDDVHENQLNTIFVWACQQQSVQDVLAAELESYENLMAEVQVLSEQALTDSHQGRALIERLPNQYYAHYQIHMPAINVWWRKRMQERRIFGQDV